MSVRGRVQSNDDDHRVATFELWPTPTGAAVALVAAWPLLAAARPLVGMAVVLAVLVALVGAEVRSPSPNRLFEIASSFV